MTSSVRNPPLTAERPECGVSESLFAPFDYWPEVELSRSRKYCMYPEGCTRKTYWLVRYPDLGPFSALFGRRCFEHMTESERAFVIELVKTATKAEYPGERREKKAWADMTEEEQKALYELARHAT